MTTTTSRPRRLLVPLATMLAAGALAVVSGAVFTSTSANPGNSYATGTLTHANSRDGQVIFQGTDLKPGESVTGTVTITNTGTLPAAFTLDESATNGFAEPELLTLTITDAATTVYDGRFGDLGSVSVGTFAPAEARTYTFVATLASTAGNDEQGKSASATYTWNGVQTP